MEQLNPLSEFFAAIDDDPRISITHIGIYAALLQYWKDHDYNSPFSAYSYQIMKLAKISARATYHKIIKDLSEYGYIRYEPSFKRNQCSKVHMFYPKCNLNENYKK
ncbi:hypothetical protein [Segetibacter koreensis]|uniref:hypothetical protein n=1 Tax=Segetibacter koreensis TaxID=398037 RepID=UPI00035ECDB4|nr:hypothetical protein [Segetibacter koreensis]